MSPIGEVEVDQRGSVLVAEISGEVDLSNVGEMERVIALSVGRDTHDVVLDLTPTMFIDSTGVRMIFELARRLRVRRHRFRLVAGEETLVHRVIAMTQLHEVVPVDASLDAALVALECEAE
jgi:anti-anti-sigma factor